MRYYVQLCLDVDPLVDSDSKVEFGLRTALCLLAHEDCNVQSEHAPITGVRILSVEKGSGHFHTEESGGPR